MRGMRRIGALGLRAGQLSSRSAQFARSRSRSSGSGDRPGPNPQRATSSSPSPSPSPSARQFLTAGIVGGALGVAVGVAVSGNGADTKTGRRDVPGGRASRDGDERRIKRLRQRAIDQEQEQSTSSPVHSARDVPWYAEVVATAGDKILDAATLLQSDHPFLEDDHMFSAFLARGIINDIEGYYSKSERTFTAVVALGQDVSGYAGIVHGGLTAAIFDEVFGGLLFCLKTKHLSVDPTHYLPSFTVNLVVDYKGQIRAGSTVLCRACVDRVEGRKLYMRAELLDGPAGRVYAESTSIFVRPRISRVAAEAGKWLAAKVKWLAVGR